jgi:predicted transposase YbfD/YdcC
MSTVPAVAVLRHFAALRDPRLERTKYHRLIDIVVIALCAGLCGCDTWVEVAAFGRAKRKWFSRFLELPNGIPSHDTFGRVFGLLDTGEFLACLRSWLEALSLAVGGDVIAIDGKTLRGSVDRAAGKSALHLVSAWSTKNRVVLAQVATDAHSNEITAIPKLLRMLELMGAVVTLDAMGCQKEIAAQIRERGGDYVFTLKGNQESLHRAVSETFDAYLSNESTDPVRVHETRETKHGREETRTYHLMPVPATLPGKEDWPGLRSIGMVVRERRVNGETTGDVRFYLTSLPPKVKAFAAAVRAHWGIENGLHWSLDVTFQEDKSRIRTGNAAETTGLLRRLVLSILRQDTRVSGSLRVKRLTAGWDETVLLQLLASFAGN